MPTRRGVCFASLRPDVNEIESWLASWSEHFVKIPAANSRPVVALICGGARLVIISCGSRAYRVAFFDSNVDREIVEIGLRYERADFFPTRASPRFPS